MNFLKTIKDAGDLLDLRLDSRFTYDISRQKMYLAHFKEPVDDIERSYFQYRCQMEMVGIIYTGLLTFFSFFTTIIYLIVLKQSIRNSKKYKVDAVFLSDDKPRNILSREILVEYPVIIYETCEDSLSLNVRDKKFIWMLIKRYPFSWMFIFKCLLKISMYSSRIHDYHPRAIITYAEFSFTSSVLTKYCEESHVLHINVMHGEKLFCIRDSFFHFHRCYIWDAFYKDLFIQLRAEPNQFRISVPVSMKFGTCPDACKKFDFTYYLEMVRTHDLIRINHSIDKLIKRGYVVAVRPHPRYSQGKVISKIFTTCEVENLEELSIEESLQRTKNAISLYSTVLNQAYQNGRCVVIDDLTNPEKYNKLVQLQYICLHKKHALLSDVLHEG